MEKIWLFPDDGVVREAETLTSMGNDKIILYMDDNFVWARRFVLSKTYDKLVKTMPMHFVDYDDAISLLLKDKYVFVHFFREVRNIKTGMKIQDDMVVRINGKDIFFSYYYNQVKKTRFFFVKSVTEDELSVIKKESSGTIFGSGDRFETHTFAEEKTQPTVEIHTNPDGTWNSPISKDAVSDGCGLDTFGIYLCKRAIFRYRIYPNTSRKEGYTHYEWVYS